MNRETFSAKGLVRGAPAPGKVPNVTPEQQQLAVAHLPLALKIAGRVRRRYGDLAPLDELRDEAAVLLCKAAVRFNGKGSFVGYASQDVYFRLCQWVRQKWSWVKVRGQGHAKAGRKKYPLVVPASGVESWVVRCGAAEDRGFGRVDDRDRVAWLLRGLSERQRRAVELVYLDQKLRREAGAEMGCSFERVRQLLNQAFDKMRARAGHGEGVAS